MAMPTESQGADVEILQKVAEETGYNFDTLWKIYGYESSFGTDEDMNAPTSSYHGPFQFDKNLADSLGIDRYDLYESAKAFVGHLDYRKERLGQNIKNTIGDSSFIDSLDPALLDYLLHQQGGKGVARLAIAHSGDRRTYNMIRGTLLKNLSEEQQKHFIDKTKSPKEALEYWVKSQEENLNRR
jgi:hypothetical protein